MILLGPGTIKLAVNESGSSTAADLGLLGEAANFSDNLDGRFEKTAAVDAADTLDDIQPIGQFAIDGTIGQFERFAEATGFISKAERSGGGFVYAAGWEQQAGWTWRTPFGRRSETDEPAIHITFDEAQAYCQWAGKRLPRASANGLRPPTPKRVRPRRRPLNKAQPTHIQRATARKVRTALKSAEQRR